eukprot:15139832-Alexandrium_andersonii.AAC.1
MTQSYRPCRARVALCAPPGAVAASKSTVSRSKWQFLIGASVCEPPSALRPGRSQYQNAQLFFVKMAQPHRLCSARVALWVFARGGCSRQNAGFY